MLPPTGPDGEPGEVYLPTRRCWPAAPAGCGPATTVRVRLVAADPATGRIEFTAAD